MNDNLVEPKKHNPRGGYMNTLERGAEKVRLALEWIFVFHFTTLPVLAERLSINENTAFRTIQKLKKQGLLSGFALPGVRSHILMLTEEGVALASQWSGKFHVCPTEYSKLNFNRLQHDLAVQRTVLTRLKESDVFFSEHQLQFDRCHKIPDALIESLDHKLAIEVELTAKTNERIYIAFERHVKALYEKLYDKIVYVFPTQTAMEYYKKRFNANAWPVYFYEEKRRRWTKRIDETLDGSDNTVYYYPQDDAGIMGKFEFCVISC